MKNSIYQNVPVERQETGSPETIERIEYKDGIRIYLAGHPQPVKGYPTGEAIQAINVIKKLAVAILGSWYAVLTPRYTLKSFVGASIVALRPYLLRSEYMTPVARELRAMLALLGTDAAAVISHIVEYDSAYRLRLQDMLSETSRTRLAECPIRELWRLVAVNRARDYLAVHNKVRRIAWLLTLALLWPPFRAAWRRAILGSMFVNLQLDDADRYWLERRTDYGELNQNKIV